MKIWLDDVRTPPDDTWEWCKNHVDFMAAIQYPPEIEFISFDHDLGDDSQNGSWCASALAERCLDYDYCPAYGVHSSNTEGGLNIISKMYSLAKVIYGDTL